jgi:hypothetical protein
MHTVELLERTIAVAQRMGYMVRQEWLGGVGGGRCEFGGGRYIFLDLSLSVGEQLDQIASALRDDPSAPFIEAPQPVQQLLGVRRAA